MLEDKPQNIEEGAPAVFVTLELVVPVIGARKPAMDDADDACASGAGFNGPLGGDGTGAFLSLDDEASRRLPCPDDADRVHAVARAEV
jgi:hypothetical protein